MSRLGDAALHGITEAPKGLLFFRIVADSRLISSGRCYKKL